MCHFERLGACGQMRQRERTARGLDRSIVGHEHVFLPRPRATGQGQRDHLRTTDRLSVLVHHPAGERAAGGQSYDKRFRLIRADLAAPRRREAFGPGLHLVDPWSYRLHAKLPVFVLEMGPSILLGVADTAKGLELSQADAETADRLTGLGVHNRPGKSRLGGVDDLHLEPRARRNDVLHYRLLDIVARQTEPVGSRLEPVENKGVLDESVRPGPHVGAGVAEVGRVRMYVDPLRLLVSDEREPSADRDKRLRGLHRQVHNQRLAAGHGKLPLHDGGGRAVDVITDIVDAGRNVLEREGAVRADLPTVHAVVTVPPRRPSHNLNIRRRYAVGVLGIAMHLLPLRQYDPYLHDDVRVRQVNRSLTEGMVHLPVKHATTIVLQDAGLGLVPGGDQVLGLGRWEAAKQDVTVRIGLAKFAEVADLLALAVARRRGHHLRILDPGTVGIHHPEVEHAGPRQLKMLHNLLVPAQVHLRVSARPWYSDVLLRIDSYVEIAVLMNLLEIVESIRVGARIEDPLHGYAHERVSHRLARLGIGDHTAEDALRFELERLGVAGRGDDLPGPFRSWQHLRAGCFGFGGRLTTM